MRVGEILCGAGEPPRSSEPGRMMVRIANTGRLAAFVSSHVPLSRLSRELACRPQPPARARLRLPAGASVRIDPGVEVEVEATWS